MYIKNKYTSYSIEKDEHIIVHPFEECLMAMQKRYKDAEAGKEAVDYIVNSIDKLLDEQEGD